jgi:hypothetical protein
MCIARQSIFAACCLLGFAASPASAQFATPFALANHAASMGAVVHQSSGPEALALWNIDNQFTYASRTGGAWTAPANILNALSFANCCVAMHADNSGNAAMVFWNGATGTYYSDYHSSSWNAVGSVPSAPPFFVNGFSAFVTNANGDAAVAGVGGDMRIARRASGSSTWTTETIPTPSLPPNTFPSIDNAAIGAGGSVVVSFHVLTTNCSPKCNLGLYAASEDAIGAGWKLSKRLSAVAHGSYMQSVPFIDAQNRAGLAFIAQYGTNYELRALRRTAVGGWKAFVTVLTEPLKQAGKKASLSLIGAETDAGGHATIVAGLSVAGTHGIEILGADGSIATNTWGGAVSLATHAAQNGAHFANNTVGGIALAWDNPDAPVSVMTRTATGNAWGTLQSVGAPSCATSTTICTQVLSLSLEDGGTQRILFNDTSSAPGTVLYSESF